YSVTVTDNLGCTGESTVTIDNPAEIGSIVQEENDASCFNALDGSARVQGSGGTTPYTYDWGPSANNQTTETATGLGSNQYVVTISDDNNCTTTIPVVIRQPDLLTVDLNGFDESCQGRSDGSILTSVAGGNGGYTFAWSDGSTTDEVTALPIGVYSVTVTDSKECTAEAETELTAPPLIQLSASSLPVSCFGDEDGRIDIEANGGTAPYRYSLNGEEYSSTSILIGLDADLYTVSVLDANDCDVEMEIEVPEPPEFTLNLVADPDTVEVGFDPFQLNSWVSNPQGDYDVTWISPYLGSLLCDSSTIDLTCKNPWVNINNTTTFSAVAEDDMGCIARDEVTVTVTKFRPVFVPTAFTPNDDNENDRLMVHGTDGTIVKLFRVYDRWGELVFQAEDFPINSTAADVTWDGNFRAKEVNPGVFIWYIEAEHIDGDKETFKGNTTLIR
ncbi:MAG: gliding motility-associated C-terminal domain-containing protein, partial [Saprospiraceae bacterium]